MTDLYVRKWGNSLGVRIPASVAREAGLSLDDRVRLVVDQGKLVLVRLAGPELTLTDRLERFDPARHAGESMMDEPVGAERW